MSSHRDYLYTGLQRADRKLCYMLQRQSPDAPGAHWCTLKEEAKQRGSSWRNSFYSALVTQPG